MTDTMRIDHITGIHLVSIERDVQRLINEFDIPGGRGLVQARGTATQLFTLECEIIESTRLAGEQKMMQLAEIVDNPDLPFHYIEFPDTETIHNGFFVIEDLRLPRNPDLLGTYIFQLRARRIGGLSDYDIALWFDGELEQISGSHWGETPMFQDSIGLPNGCTYVTEPLQDPSFDTRLGADGGTNPLAVDISRNVIRFKMSSTIADWFKAECVVYDTVTSGNTDESTWIQVFSPTHIFSGDCIIQNNLLRYNSATSTFYVYDTVSDPMGWVSIGTLKIRVSPSLYDTTTTAFELTRITPDEIRWQEIREHEPDSAYLIVRLEYVLRRGMRHCKVTLKTFKEATIETNGICLEGTGFFVYIFNDDYDGVGSIELPVSDGYYHCGFNQTRNVIMGFVLCDEPSKQPVASGNLNQLMQSNEWGTNTGRTFFIVGWPFDTSGDWRNVIAYTRDLARFIAIECMYAVHQELFLLPRGYYA